MSSKLIEIHISDNQTIWVEADPEVSLEQRGGMGVAVAMPSPEEIAQRVEKGFEGIALFVRQRGEQFAQQFEHIAEGAKPDKLTLEVGVAFEGSVGIPIVTGAKGTANVKITAEWTLKTASPAPKL